MRVPGTLNIKDDDERGI